VSHFIVLFFLVAVFPACSGSGAKWFAKLVPADDEVPGIDALGSATTYAGQRLFDYIDGGADIYYEYGFRRLAVQKYRAQQGDVILEIYQMETPSAAYGIYTTDVRGEHPSLGQDATYAGGLLTFWKGTHFVRIFADTDTDAARSLLIRLGEVVAKNIPDKGDRPEILARVPARGGAARHRPVPAGHDRVEQRLFFLARKHPRARR
jgi:hypothetical protein